MVQSSFGFVFGLGLKNENMLHLASVVLANGIIIYGNKFAS
jgi:hypothetical protein